MLPKNVISTLTLQSNFDSVLFKFLFHCAGYGSRLWVVSPEKFEKLPHNVVPPEKEILELITFMYLKDFKDIVTQFNGIHLWQRIPNVIIVIGFEIYCNDNDSNFNINKAALLLTTLLDSAAFCTTQYDKLFLLVVANEVEKIDKNQLNTLVDMYFSNVVTNFEELNKMTSAVFENH